MLVVSGVSSSQNVAGHLRFVGAYSDRREIRVRVAQSNTFSPNIRSPPGNNLNKKMTPHFLPY